MLSLFRAVALAAALVVSAPAVPQTAPVVRHSGVLNGVSPADLAEVVPPQRYQGDTATVVIFSRRATAEMCAGGTGVVACTKVYRNGAVLMLVPNPCEFAGREFYATVVCHEMGHLNGWSGAHGD